MGPFKKSGQMQVLHLYRRAYRAASKFDDPMVKRKMRRNVRDLFVLYANETDGGVIQGVTVREQSSDEI
jgi:hypothetical protein